MTGGGAFSASISATAEVLGISAESCGVVMLGRSGFHLPLFLFCSTSNSPPRQAATRRYPHYSTRNIPARRRSPRTTPFAPRREPCQRAPRLSLRQRPAGAARPAEPAQREADQISDACGALIKTDMQYGGRLLRPRHCLPPGDFRPAETHRNPSGKQLQHELSGVTAVVRHVIGKRDAGAPLPCHDAQFKWRRVCRKAVAEHRQPVSLGEVEKHCRIAALGNDASGGGIGLEPMLFKILVPHHALYSILSI